MTPDHLPDNATPPPRWSTPSAAERRPGDIYGGWREGWGGPVRPAPAPPPRPKRPNYWLHGGLFVATIVTTILVGGFLYSACIMAILLAHEMGHYVTARHYRVPATPPYFIPLPLPPFGTMGAVIRLSSTGANRRQLFDIAVAGPIAGLVMAIPACIVGLHLSHVVETSRATTDFSLGSPLLFQGLSDMTFGHLREGLDVSLHPVAYAGWVGLFVTALNLLPVGQLDGGHLVYALLGRRANWFLLAAGLLLIGLAIFINREWLLLAALLFFFGLQHPPTADDGVPLGLNRRIIGVALLIVFVLCFTPRPFAF